MSTTTESRPKASLGIIFFIAFLDLFGFGIILPIFAPLFFDEANILGLTLSENARNLLYGIVLGGFSLCQFLGAPVMGAVSDRVGRKKALLFMFCVNGIGALCFAWSILAQNLGLLLLSRFLPGLFGSSLMITQTVIADISSPKTKAKNFGLIGVAFGLGFIFGPIAGAILGNINFAIPFAVAGTLTFLNGAFMWFALPETLVKKASGRINLLSGITNLKKAFTTPKLKQIFLVVFFLNMGFALFTQFFQVYLIEIFSFSQREIGYMFAWIGIWIAITQGGILRPIANRFSPVNILKFTIPLFALTYLLAALPTNAVWLAAALVLFSIFQGLTFPNTLAIISNLANNSVQGETIGINQSVQSFAYGFPPILASFTLSINLKFPNWFGFACTMLAFVLFYFAFIKKKD